MSKKITFTTQPIPYRLSSAPSDLTIPIPKKSSLHMPDWYNKSERWLGSDKAEIKNYSANQGLKHCIPFLDVMTSGYMIELWTDIQVKRDINNEAEFTWLSHPDPLLIRDQRSGKTIPRPAGHDEMHYGWICPFAIKVPKGYSVLLTHPANRFDLPFTTLSGIMDSDSYYPSGTIPFFLKNDFEGIIKTGTPIAQLFPYKRESWVSESGSKELQKEIQQQGYDTQRSLGGLYKALHWTRKNYE